MGIHRKTLEVIKENQDKLTSELVEDIESSIGMALDYSPLSDFNFLKDKLDKTISNITSPQDKSTWAPIRNIIRIVAKVTEIENDKKIDKINITDMYCGCDYFEGSLEISFEDGESVSGPYRWQWSAFNDFDRHFDKFTVFPVQEILSKQNMK